MSTTSASCSPDRAGFCANPKVSARGFLFRTNGSTDLITSTGRSSSFASAFNPREASATCCSRGTFESGRADQLQIIDNDEAELVARMHAGGPFARSSMIERWLESSIKSGALENSSAVATSRCISSPFFGSRLSRNKLHVHSGRGRRACAARAARRSSPERKDQRGDRFAALRQQEAASAVLKVVLVLPIDGRGAAEHDHFLPLEAKGERVRDP